MPFNASGTYTLSDEIANSTSADATELQAILDDIETALNSTFLRDGSATATGQFLGIVGATPQYSFSGDANTGFGSDTGDEVYLEGGGVKTLRVNATSGTLTGTLHVTGAVTFDGALTVTGKMGLVSLDIATTTALTAPAVGDLLPIYDLSATANRAIALSDFFKVIDGLTAKATPVAADEVVIYDVAGSAAKKATLTQINAGLPGPYTRQDLTSGSSATYTTPAGCRAIKIRMIGGGGGAGAASSNSGNTGGTTSFNSITAIGGGGGQASANTGGVGGTGGSGSALRIAGADGGPSAGSLGGIGGSGAFGGNGHNNGNSSAGTAGKANSGGGGGGGTSGGTGGSGGGSGEYVEFTIASPSATYTYTVGAGGGGGAAGGAAGGDGGSGLIIVDEYY